MEALCAKFPLLHCVHSCFSVLGVLLLIRQGLTLVPMAGLQWVALLRRTFFIHSCSNSAGSGNGLEQLR